MQTLILFPLLHTLNSTLSLKLSSVIPKALLFFPNYLYRKDERAVPGKFHNRECLFPPPAIRNNMLPLTVTPPPGHFGPLVSYVSLSNFLFSLKGKNMFYRVLLSKSLAAILTRHSNFIIFGNPDLRVVRQFWAKFSFSIFTEIIRLHHY